MSAKETLDSRWGKARQKFLLFRDLFGEKEAERLLRFAVALREERYGNSRGGKKRLYC